jgi:hypothetical protein
MILAKNESLLILLILSKDFAIVSVNSVSLW